ncbi:two-component sensor histidine kinase [Plantactinospora endophytica]|uniref:histidine kinase n=2 Tax=Plantactinospora endophytica TaxID=673535 RepID=A0ABQ4DX71_9ACTN|nr:sensor histidine kinase [Plantactinospora endophytica]GIG87041.1 two-component sensor histidine kinase [Plantactinospora endophytica]
MSALALLSVVLSNSMGSFPLGPPPSWPEQLTWAVLVGLPLIWRRTHPEISTAVLAAIFIAAQVRHSPEVLVSSATLYIALYSLGAWGRDRRLSARIRIGVIVAMFAWLAIAAGLSVASMESNFPGGNGPISPFLAAAISSVLFNLAFFLLAYLLGNRTWTSALRQHELEVQAEALRRSRAENAERAVTQERVRIARELHDVVAHHVSVMGVQASASRRVMDKDPDKAKTALAAVEQSARTAVDELRRMLGVLRNAGANDGALGYGLDQVDSLLQGARDAGLAVEYTVYGTPVPVPESVSLAGYRVVQEAMTNTIKHARASAVDVRIRYLRREVEVEVTDDGRTGRAVPPPRSPGGGLGLIGMRERVAAHDGSLEVGARDGGGFRVRARFPIVSGGSADSAATVATA